MARRRSAGAEKQDSGVEGELAGAVREYLDAVSPDTLPVSAGELDRRLQRLADLVAEPAAEAEEA